GPLSWLVRSGINFKEIIAPATMASDGGFAIIALLHPPRFFETQPDSASAPTASHLRLFEDGKELGPGHTMGVTIKSSGHGPFSHWSGHVYFSSSDGTDPRTNGRRYSAQYPILLNSQGAVLAILMPAVLFAIAKFGYDAVQRRSLLPSLQPWT